MNTNKTFNDLFKEHYYTNSLPTKDKVKYDLIQRYSDKVSPRLKKESDDLYNKGKILYGNLMKEIICSPNQFLKHVTKEKDWENYIPIPFECNK